MHPLAMSMHEEGGGTYNLIVKNRERDQSAISMCKGLSGTYILVIKDRGREGWVSDQLVQGTRQHLHPDHQGQRQGGIGQQSAYTRDTVALTI